MTALDWNLEYDGQVIPLFKYEQLQGLCTEALKSRAARLQDILAVDYDFPPKTSNSSDALIRYILCLQSRIACDLQGSNDILAVSQNCFLAPDHLIEAERLRPTTPPRRREGSLRKSSRSVFSRSSARSSRVSEVGGADPVTVVVSNTQLHANTANVCAASLLEVSVKGKLLPMYHYDQLQYLKHDTLVARVRSMVEIVSRVWELPKPSSRRSEDLIIFLLCVQAQIVAFQYEEPLDPRDVLVNGFGAPTEWADAVETRHSMRASFYTQKQHYKSKYGDQLTTDQLGLQPREGAQEEDLAGKRHEGVQGAEVDPYSMATTDHLRGDVSVGVGFSDTAVEGYLPKCIGHGKRHIEFDESDELAFAQRQVIAPDDHLTGGGVVDDFDGKCDDEVGRGHGRRYLDSFMGANERKSGRILLSGHL